jgi:hypothetical protein
LSCSVLYGYCLSQVRSVIYTFVTRCSSAAGGKLVEPTPEIERELATELEKVAKQYGGGEGVDMTQFPSFKFKGKYGRICVIDYKYHLESLSAIRASIINCIISY